MTVSPNGGKEAGSRPGHYRDGLVPNSLSPPAEYYGSVSLREAQGRIQQPSCIRLERYRPKEAERAWSTRLAWALQGAISGL